MNNPSGFLNDNLAINQNTISAAFKTRVKNFINIGSSCMYPRDLGVLREEDLLTAPLEPTNEGYALAKITAAKHCEYLSLQDGVHYKTLIPCNLYGPDDNFDLETGHLIACAITKIRQAIEKNDETVEIWGTGKVRREFLYIDDLADFIVNIAVPRLSDLPTMLNVGYGEDFTVQEYYEYASKALNFKGSFTYNLSKPVGMTHKLMNSSKAKAFGWAPKVTIDQGLLNIKQVFKIK